MKIKEGFILRNVAGQNVVVAVGSASVNFNGMLKVNDVGALLWQKIDEGADEEALIKAVTEKYEVDDERAVADIRRYVNKLIEAGFVEE